MKKIKTKNIKCSTTGCNQIVVGELYCYKHSKKVGEITNSNGNDLEATIDGKQMHMRIQV